MQTILNFHKDSFYMPVCQESSKNTALTPQISVLKILFDMWELWGGCGPLRFESVVVFFFKYDKVRQESFWRGTYAIKLDVYTLLQPNCGNLSHASVLCSIMAHCALTHTVDPRFVIFVHDIVHWGMLQKASMIIERKHKEWTGACSAMKQRAVYPSC